jgi:hypothetical protein
MNEANILTLLEKITAAYPNFELTEDRIQLWNDSLLGFYMDEAEANLDKHILTNVFPPTIADITKLGGSMEWFRVSHWEGECKQAIATHLRDGKTMDTFDIEHWRIKIRFAKIPKNYIFEGQSRDYIEDERAEQIFLENYSSAEYE